MASLQLRLDCAGVSLQRLCMLDRITVLSNFIVEVLYSQEDIPSKYLSADVVVKHKAPLSLGLVCVKELIGRT